MHATRKKQALSLQRHSVHRRLSSLTSPADSRVEPQTQHAAVISSVIAGVSAA